MRARKYERNRIIPPANVCFNGAAPVRARKYVRVYNSTASTLTLQRGRACEGAEIITAEDNADLDRALQRGRACEGAEIDRAMATRFGATMLQRGRACEGAEMPLSK